MFFNSTINSSFISLNTVCQTSVASIVINTVYTFISILLLPLHILILFIGVQQCRRLSLGATISTSDFFTYHVLALEVFCCFGSSIYTFGIYFQRATLFMSGMFLFTQAILAQTLFHVLTCVERYIAVVFPVAYINSRKTLGTKIRNINAVCVWLLFFGRTAVNFFYLPDFPTTEFFSVFSVLLFIIVFCCLSILGVLTRAGPGKLGRDKEPLDKSKQRVFLMIMAIAGAMLCRFVGLLVHFGLESIGSTNLKGLCALMDSGNLMMVPSSLVVPLLFLHRTGKLACCCKKS